MGKAFAQGLESPQAVLQTFDGRESSDSEDFDGIALVPDARFSKREPIQQNPDVKILNSGRRKAQLRQLLAILLRNGNETIAMFPQRIVNDRPFLKTQRNIVSVKGGDESA